MIFSFYDTVLLFFIYSFLGWCVEVAFVAVTVGRVENRGFLNGPICPIYGCGMLGVLMALIPISNQWFLLFLGGMAICSAVELFGGWILDKIFHMRWWDYSDKPFNIGGYICLGFSIMWGIAVVFAVRMIHPMIMAGLKMIPRLMGVTIICLLATIFIVDMVVTLKNLFGIKKNLGQLDKLAEDLHNIGDQIKDVVGNSAITVVEKAEESMDKIDAKEKFEAQMAELEKRRDELIDKIQKSSRHTLNKLPALNKSGKSINIKEYINALKRK